MNYVIIWVITITFVSQNVFPVVIESLSVVDDNITLYVPDHRARHTVGEKAENVCRNEIKDGKLAILFNEARQEAAEKLLKGLTNYTRVRYCYTMGLSRKNENYVWSDGKKLKFSAWASGQPISLDPKRSEIFIGNCLKGTQYKWFVKTKNQLRYYLCQAFDEDFNQTIIKDSTKKDLEHYEKFDPRNPVQLGFLVLAPSFLLCLCAAFIHCRRRKLKISNLILIDSFFHYQTTDEKLEKFEKQEKNSPNEKEELKDNRLETIEKSRERYKEEEEEVEQLKTTSLEMTLKIPEPNSSERLSGGLMPLNELRLSDSSRVSSQRSSLPEGDNSVDTRESSRAASRSEENNEYRSKSVFSSDLKSLVHHNKVIDPESFSRRDIYQYPKQKRADYTGKDSQSTSDSVYYSASDDSA